jgi:hypothetical protein
MEVRTTTGATISATSPEGSECFSLCLIFDFDEALRFMERTTGFRPLALLASLRATFCGKSVGRGRTVDQDETDLLVHQLFRRLSSGLRWKELCPWMIRPCLREGPVGTIEIVIIKLRLGAVVISLSVVIKQTRERLENVRSSIRLKGKRPTRFSFRGDCNDSGGRTAR